MWRVDEREPTIVRLRVQVDPLRVICVSHALILEKIDFVTMREASAFQRDVSGWNEMTTVRPDMRSSLSRCVTKRSSRKSAFACKWSDKRITDDGASSIGRRGVPDMAI